MSSSADSKTFVIPDNLKPRCMRAHGWGAPFAGKALLGYQLFMKLKANHEDYDATKLSPSLTVDLVWHQHILDPKHYLKACQDYCGEVIGHDPDGALDFAARAERIKKTKQCLEAFKTFFGKDVDAEIWSFEDQDGGDAEPSAPKRRRVSNEELITIQVCDLCGRETSINIGKDEQIQKLFDIYAQKKGLSVSNFMFLMDGNHIDPTRTPEMLALSDLDRVTVLLRRPHEVRSDDEPITIRIRDQTGEETFFKLKKTTKMQKVFDTYAQQKGTCVDSLHFLLDGERIEPTQTPKMLELDDQDQVDVMLVQAAC